MPFSVAAESVILGRGSEGCAWGQVTEAYELCSQGWLRPQSQRTLGEGAHSARQLPRAGTSGSVDLSLTPPPTAHL